MLKHKLVLEDKLVNKIVGTVDGLKYFSFIQGKPGTYLMINYFIKIYELKVTSSFKA